MNIYFTADMHLDHANIIKYCDRPFYKEDDFVGEGDIAKRQWTSPEIKLARCQQMNNALIDNWNNKVSSDDLVYHVGDFSFKGANRVQQFERLLNGDIVHIRGNHDANNGVKTYIVKAMMEFGGKEVFVQHHPTKFHVLADFAICGHVHNNWKHKIVKDELGVYPDFIVINVGTDVWNYEPVSVNSLIKYYHLVKNGLVNEMGERI